jgi:hypothetical protein
MAEQTFNLLDLAEKLPPILSRDRIEKTFGGVITAKRLQNLDSLGDGPPIRLRIGRKVAYPTRDFLVWLTSRSEVLK